MPRLPSIKKVSEEDEFYHVRFRQPHRFSKIRTPDWAAEAAREHSKGAEVRMGKLESSGTWKVQSVLIEKKYRNEDDAQRLAEKIIREIEA